jgi:AraC-like DNA-binding protein
MDVLSNVLGATNLTTRILGTREYSAPWAVEFAAESNATLHIVRRGSAYLRFSPTDTLTLEAGDIALVSAGVAHTVGGALTGPEPSESTLLQSAKFSFTHDAPHPLLALLPPVVKFTADDLQSDPELRALFELIGSESLQPDQGSYAVVPRLLEALFVYLVRAWVRQQPPGAAGWLGALRDPQLRKALTQIHQSPQVPWTVESLARSVAMSRAAFAKRFTDLVGEPPLAYITRWRMDLAAKMLRESGEPVARIASRVGYISETAFAKAFRRRRKIAPGQYRYGRTARRASAQAASH